MKFDKQTNVFIAHTPLQNFIATKIVKQFFHNKGFSNRIYTSVITEENKLFDTTYVLEKKNGLKKTLQLIKVKKKINNILKNENSQIFISHTAALLDNYYFYSYPFQSNKVRINFYYEGILYFYKYLEPYKRNIHSKRKIFAWICGFSYKAEPEILPVFDPSVNHIYSILKKFTIGPREKINEISLLKENYTPVRGNILIMGGKPSLLSNDEVIVLYDKMITYIYDLPQDNTIFFKGHHADTSSNFDIANKGRLKIVDVTQNKPVEEVIDSFSPSVILSYPSSGLINLKAMYGNQIIVNCYYNESKKEHLSKLWPIFDYMGINTMFI